MPTTIEGAVVFIALVAPGLLFEIGLSRGANHLRRSLADRVLRFLAWSLMAHVVLFPVTVALYRMTAGDLTHVGVLPIIALWGWLLVLAGGPYWAGTSISGLTADDGRPAHGWRRKVARAAFGRGPEPLAWHWLWKHSEPAGGFVRVRLRDSGDWIVGQWVYSADDPDDLLIDRYRCSRRTGELKLDDQGLALTLGWRTLVRVCDLDRIEFQPGPNAEDGSDERT